MRVVTWPEGVAIVSQFDSDVIFPCLSNRTSRAFGYSPAALSSYSSWLKHSCVPSGMPVAG